MEKFIFLDRDGVINKDPASVGKEYVTDWKEFQFLPGALEAIKCLTGEGYKIAIISNQAGVERGIYTKTKLDEITEKMLKAIESDGGKIYAVQYCVHTRAANCDCRKPKGGLFKKAVKGLEVDYKKTYFVGDTQSDIEAGRNIGCRTILVLSGKTKNREETAGWPVKPDFIMKDLSEAVAKVVS